MRQTNTVCTAVIGSMTQAIRAQEALAAASVRAAVIKIGSTQTRDGCAYGLSYPCLQTTNVRTILSDAGIPVRRYLGEVSDRS